MDTRAPLRRIADPLSPVFEKLLTEHAPDAVTGEIAEPRRGDGQRARASWSGWVSSGSPGDATARTAEGHHVGNHSLPPDRLPIVIPRGLSISVFFLRLAQSADGSKFSAYEGLIGSPSHQRQVRRFTSAF